MGNNEILKIFEVNIQKRILEYCAKINKSNADLYILMARKAACFVNALERASLVSINGRVISERALDCKLEWENIKSVVIIDDVIISGTTLYQTIKAIRSHNPAITVKVIVLGINEKWFNQKLLNDENGNSYIAYPIKTLNNTECIRLSGDIVKMLSLIPLPYNIDYPIYNTLKLNDLAYSKMLSLPGWEVSEASSLIQDNRNIFTYSFIPTNGILNYSGTFFNNPLISDSLLKIRLYGRSSLEKRKGIHSVRIVPMAILPPLKHEDVEALFQSIAGSFLKEIASYLTTITSKLRFVQYAIADQLARVFIQEIDYFTDKDTIIIRENETMRLLFPEPIIPQIITAANANSFNFKFEYNRIRNKKKTFLPPYTQDDLIGINNTLMAPFLDMYYGGEIPARRLVLEFGPDVFDKQKYVNIINRLKHGYSLIDLENLLSNYSVEFRKRLISVFLDKAVDNGIAVPITVEEGDIIFRAFRHGEDVQFGQREERLCMEMLNAFNDEVSKGTWQKLWVEKLLVLFLKMGESKFLDPIQTEISGYSSYASVRYYLQGPVVVKKDGQPFSENPCLEYSDKVKWLTRDLLISDRFPLSLNENGLYVFNEDIFNERNYTDHDQEIIIEPTLINQVTEIGQVLGRLIDNHVKGLEPGLDSDDLVALSCCMEPKDIIGALAAEINIAIKSYKTGYNLDSIEDLCRSIELMDNIDSDKIKGIRKGSFFQAINDGIRKYQWYKTGYPQSIIERVSSKLRRRRDIIQWESLWSPNASCLNKNEVSSKVANFIDLEGLWLLCVKAYILIIEYHFYHINKNLKCAQRTLLQLENHEKALYPFSNQKDTNKLLVNIIPFISEFKRRKDEIKYNQTILEITLEKLDIMMNRSFSILENANIHFKSFNYQPDIRYYQTAIYICLEHDSYLKEMTDLFTSICFKITKSHDEVKVILRDMPTPAVPPHDKNGVWYVGIGSGAEKWLLQFAAELMSRLRSKTNYKIIFFPSLPDSCKIKLVDKYIFSCNNFQNINSQLNDWIRSLPFQNNAIYEIRELSKDKSIGQDNKKFKAAIIENKESIVLYTPNPVEFYKITYRVNMNESYYKRVNVGILTIVTEEAQAVNDSFNVLDYNKINNRYFYEFEHITSTGRKIEGVHLQSSEPGNTSIVNAFNALISHYACDFIVLIGIAGGIKDEIELCDVFIGTNVLYYDRRKEKADGSIDHRAVMFNNSFSFTQNLNRFFLLNSEPAEFERNDASKGKRKFRVHRGPIGSGEAVIGNPLSPTKEWLQSVNSKVGIVETEAAGFFQAYYEMGEELTNSFGGNTEIIAIRGVSDHADHNKDDNYRLEASMNAVFTLKKLIEVLFPK